MYDISQLNDMLLPELQDIADELKIEDSKKLNKQDLVYKILDRQALAGTGSKSTNPAAAGERPKRKRIIKATTSNSTEEAVVEDTSVPAAIEVAAEEPRKHA
ncbi:MAG TPA: Rho termination factor N-terminal domain-containing protein, partial [Flavisolibacter sp.]|nr:Rho termination factor N-terminal domain-containing protein [Flavisolibacter sp.]